MLFTVLNNVFSIIFGLFALLFPVLSLVLHKKINHKRFTVLTAASIFSCAISFCFQISELSNRVAAQDWAALMDTSRFVSSAAGMLLGVTIILNIIAMAVYFGKRSDA